MSFFFFKILFILDRREGREKDRERKCVVASHVLSTRDLTWAAAQQACALTGNRTSNPLVCRPALNPLHHTSHSHFELLLKGEKS